MLRQVLLLTLLACYIQGKADTDTTKNSFHILYIGNSLTYTNELPALIEEIARQDGKTISSYSITQPGYSLEDHWNSGNAEAEIEKGVYDLVVLQQGPSALPESQVLLLDYAGRFAKVCREHHAQSALYMVWPSRSRLFDLDNVINAYSTAASKTGSFLFPAGLAWKYAWQANPSVALYGPDHFHPGIDGSVLAALTIYAGIAGKKDYTFLLWDKCSWKNSIGENTLNLLKEAALKANP